MAGNELRRCCHVEREPIAGRGGGSACGDQVGALFQACRHCTVTACVRLVGRPGHEDLDNLLALHSACLYICSAAVAKLHVRLTWRRRR
eukprot:2919458-Amphidinium_carterae.2